MPCTPLFPLPHGVVACFQCRRPPWPIAQPLHAGELAAGRCSHPRAHPRRGRADRLGHRPPFMRRTSPTYLPAHASLSLAPPHNGRTDHAARGPYGSRRSRPRRRARADSASRTWQASTSPSKRRLRANSTGLLNAPSPQTTGQNEPRRPNLLRRPPPVSAILDSPIKRAPEPLQLHLSPPPPPTLPPSHPPGHEGVIFSLSGHRSAASAFEPNHTLTPPEPPKLRRSTPFPPLCRNPKPIPLPELSPTSFNFARTTVRRRRAHRRSGDRRWPPPPPLDAEVHAGHFATSAGP